jgi:hypothetical protein
MRRSTRSGLRRDRKARWLIVLTGTVGLLFFFWFAPVTASAEGLSGRMSFVYATTDSTSTDNFTGTTTDFSSRAIAQQYSLTADKFLYPNVRLFASGLFQKTDATSSTNGQGTWGDSTVIRPYIDLTLRTPVFAAGVNYNAVTTETKTLNAPTMTLKHEAYGGILGMKPEGLPTLDMVLSRSYSYDENRVLQDIVTDSVSLYSRYDPTKTVRLRYQGSYSDTQDRLKNVDNKTTGNDMRIMYDDQYLRDRISVSTYYDYANSTTEITSSGKGTVNFQVLAVDGLSLNSDNLLTDPLRSSPFLIDNTMTGPTNAANNIGSATSAASPPDTAARNIGLQFPTATEMNTLNVWVYSVTGATVDIAVPAYLPAPVAGSLTWAVYTSNDNLNWRLYQPGMPAPYEIDVSRPGVGRFEITFPNVVTKYIKVVVSPLSPFAAGGQGREFPGIYVTELQAFTARPAADVTGKFSSSTQLAGLSTKVILLKTPGLNYDFSYFYNKQESQFSTTLYTTMANALSVQHRFNPVFYGSAQVQRVDDSSPAGDQVTLQAGGQIVVVPLRTLSHTIGVSSSTIQRSTGRSKSNAATLTNTAELYPNINAFLNGGLSSNISETDQKMDSRNYSAGINLIPIQTLNITLSSGGQTSDLSGGGVPDSTQSTRSNEISASYYPVPALYLFASRSVRSGSGQANDRLTNYGLNWAPFAGGDLVFNYSYFETRRAFDNSIDKSSIPSLRWNITRKAYATIAYNSTQNTSNIGQSTTRIESASFNVIF